MSKENQSVNEKEMETDSEDSSDDEERQIVESKAEELEKQLSVNKYYYDAHVELVDLYKQLGDLTSLRAAYVRFQQLYPLTSSLWLSWIKIEMGLADKHEEKQNVLKLFEKAVEDYLSIELWQEYIQFCIGYCNQEETRAILNKALNSAGLHVTHGSLLWDTLREYELAHLSLHEVGSENWKQQILKVAEVFRRQLSVPLINMESTYEEFKIWLEMLPEDNGVDTKSIEWGYKKALKILEGYKQFEDRLLTAETEDDILQVYRDYIKSTKDPSFILCLYERAVAQFPLNVSIWEDYCWYCIQLGGAALSVSSRALRNCPWSENLWVLRIRILEHEKSEEKVVLDCFEQGISTITTQSTLELWLTFLEYARRNFTDIERIKKLFDQARQQLWSNTDPTCKITRLYARILARNNDMEAARRLWSDIVHKMGKNNVNVWLEFASLERQYGQPQNLRSLFQRALSSCTDWPQYVMEEWLMFEREEGSLESVLKCLEKCKLVNIKVTNYESGDGREGKGKEGKDSKYEEVKIKKGIRDEKRNSRKRQHEEEGEVFNKKSKKVENKNDPGNEECGEKCRRVTSQPHNLGHEKSIFVSNLQPRVDENHLQEMFPNSKKIFLVVDRKGISRCYAYIQFETAEIVEEQLKRDREPLNGRPVFISKCKPDRQQRESVFKYSTTMEKNKLFVKNLPKACSRERLEEFYKPYGAISVRIVTQKSGESKGLAYIEFSDDEKASQALKATNGMKIDDREIIVAISAPPPKKIAPEGESKEPIRHARTKLQTSLIPRGLQLRAKRENGDGIRNDGRDNEGGRIDEDVTQKEHSRNETKVKAKTNEDFRKMLLNK